MKEFIKKYQKLIVGLGAVSALTICYLQQKELTKLRSERDNLIHHMVDAHAMSGGDIAKAQTIDSLQKRCDSLYDELFPAQIELGRYQVAYEIFMERNPKAAQQYGTIISEETE
jgi:hypothetical protein